MSAAIAFLAGLGSGYLSGKDKAKDRERQEKKDQQADEVFNATMDEKRQAKADKEALRTAGADVAVQEVAPPNEPMDINGPPATAANNVPTTTSYKVGAKSFAERGLADAEATSQNSVEAKRTRTMAALAAQGNVVGADQMRTSGMQADAAKMGLDKGKREEANAIFDQGVKTALQTGGPQGLADFMSNSTADGRDGAVKFKAVTAPDGKTWQMHRVGEDGATVPFGQSFTSDEGGLATAGMMLSRSVPDTEKVKHVMAEKEAARKAAHDEGTLGVAKQNADTQEKWRKDQAANMAEQRRLQAAHDAAIAAGKAQAGGAIQVGLKDMRDFEGDMDKYIKDQYPVKDGLDSQERAGINAQATAAKSLGSSIFKSNASVGIPLTAGTVMQAMELGKDRKNVQIVQVNGVAHESVVVNGQHVITSGPLQKRAPAPQGAPAQPGAPVPAATAPANSPAAAARAGVAPAAPAQQFNEAGYASTQATIDGAKRGDAKALAMLQKLIAQGTTSPAERNQIAQLTK